MAEITEAERKVLDAAREWMTERVPKDREAKALAAAVARAYPEDMPAWEDCTCGESETCDECLTRAEVEALVLRWERESTPIAEAK